ncbi:unnamed protein product [Soboliphyme baturini]|uniref:DHC_N1 domain-containing protein n=1 Tax=Soboliphyme baturini TaxID=241478 RepID=A0A183ITC9_9BILA|nr:unnamed protein product [Soboliphyme baturini]
MAETGTDRGAGEGQAQSEVAQIELAEVSAFIPYLRRMVKVLVEDDADDKENVDYLSALDDCMKMPATIECLRKFIADQQTQVLLIERIRLKENEDSSQMSDHELEPLMNVVYQMSLDVHFTNPRTVGIVLIKCGPVIEAEKPFNKQVRFLSLSDGSPYETLHSYISAAVSPYFKSYIKESGRAESYRDGDKVAPSVEKKLMELEMGLLHLQQNIEIPEVTLVIHPMVQAVVKKAAEKNTHPSISDLGDLIDDSTFLNQLQNGVNRWIREIQKVTKLDRDPTSGTALQEITFWLNLERALIKLQAKRESPEVTLTLNILKHGKRFHATVSFDTDTGLKQAIDMVNDYNLLMKDFPVNDLLSASELDRIRMAVTAIFNHLRKIRNTYYPVQRCLHLLETISKDLQLQMLKVLSVRRLMHINFEEFDKIMNQAFEIFSCWDDEYDKLQLLLRDLLKKKRDEQFKIVLRLSPIHKRLQTRLEQMRRFRRQHEQLRTVIVRVLRPVPQMATQQDELVSPEIENPPILDTADAQAIEVDVAYEHVKDIDCLDLTKEGIEAWESALKRYEERIDRVEARITTRLRDQLESAKNANEMFRIFSRFNALFVRPHIRGAIREYQTQLIQRVKEDIETLHEKFKVQYIQSKASSMSRVHDLPPVSGSVIWARQIDRQLSRYLRRVEDVLGKGWENHIEGQKLKADGDSFRLKLNPQSIFDAWVARVQARNIGVSGRIFLADTVRGYDGKSTLRLRVNFPLEITALSKEVRNFKHMGFRVPLAIVNKAHQANELYPFAISLIESVHIYESMNVRIVGRKCIELLIAGTKKEIQQLIIEGTNLVWESYKLDSYVKRFSELVTHYEEKVEELLNMEEQISLQLTLLDTCQYAAPVFQQILATIQKIVDNLSLHLFSNLVIWVEQLDEQIEKKLAFRLQEGAKAWTAVLQGKPKEEFDSTENIPEKVKLSLGGDPKLQQLIHEIRLTQQVMYLSPSVEEARQNLLQQLFAWEAIVCTQSRISSTRYQVGAERSNTITNYRNVLGILPEGQKCLDKAYACADDVISEVKSYVDDWLRYQALWDLQPETLFERLDNNLPKWMTTLQEIKKTRSTFDTAETRKQFGPIIIDYARVQSKVSLKYDSWHKDVLKRFGSLLGSEIQQLYSTVSKSRGDLEQQSVDAGSTSEAVGFITYVQNLKRKTAEWEPQVDLFKEGQKILERQRFQFPSSWLYSDNLDGEWSAFCDILGRKDSAIQTQVTSLQNKIKKEDEVVKSRTTELLSEWDRQKPNEGSQKPDLALQSLSVYEHKLMRLKEDADNIIKAKEALELPETVHVSPLHERLCASIEELNDLKNVWNAMKPLHQAIDEIREKSWVSVQPKKLRQSIDALLNQMRELPSDYRNYESYDYVKMLLQGYAKMNILVIELKSETLKERHWKQLMKQLKVNWVLSELTLGQKHEATIKDIILVAQGEMALEVFLKQLREYWQNFELDLINYQSKTKLIRGWDDLFNKLKDHINGISAMKLSPYYKEFEEDAAVWEERLNRITSLFDVWIDVQRRWVYLEGIFSGSADIKTLLPVETSKFKR